MSIIVKDQGQRSQLQERLAAELREKIAKTQGAGPAPKPDTPDLVKDSAYMKDYEKKFSPNARVVAILVVCLVLAAIFGLVLMLS